MLIGALSPGWRGGGSLAARLFANEPEGLTANFTDMSMLVKDLGTPANFFSGSPALKLAAYPTAKWIEGSDGNLSQSTALRPIYRGGVALGLLTEGAAANPVLHNRDFSQSSWAIRGSVTSSRTVTGAGGVANTGNRVVFSATGGGNDILDNNWSVGGRFANGAALKASLYLRKVTSTGVIRIGAASGDANGSMTIDLSLLGSGYERITDLHPAVTASTPFVASGTGASGFLIYAVSGVPITADLDFVQLEAGASVTSPIEVGATAVTRLADVCGLDASAFPYGATERTLMVEAAPEETGATQDVMFLLGASGIVEANGVYNGSGSPVFINRTGSVTNFQESVINVGTRGVFVKYGIASKLNDYIGCCAGTLSAADTSGALSAPTRLVLGSSGYGSGANNKIIKQIAIFPRRFTNTQLQALAAA